MSNLIKSVKVNGTSYEIDFASLANRPAYKDITLGEFLVNETTLSFTADDSNPYFVSSVGIQEAIEDGEKFLISFDGVEYEGDGYVSETSSHIVYEIFYEGGVVRWAVTADQSTWETGGWQIPAMGDYSGGHTVSIRRITKDLKTLDRELLGVIAVPSGSYPVVRLEKGFAPVDLIGAILKYGSYECALIEATYVMDNGFISIYGAGDYYCTYNPVSGYLIGSEGSDTVFDVLTQEERDSYTSELFIGAALVHGSGEPVIISRADLSGNMWYLVAAERYLKDGDGNIVHDFSLDPVYFNADTGDFAVNNGNKFESLA